MLNKQQQQELKAATFPYNVKPTLWLTKNRPFFFSSREFHPLLLHQLWASKTTEKRKTKTKYKIIRKKTGEEKFPLLPMSLKQYLLELHFSSVFRKLPKNKNKAKKCPSDSPLDSGLKGPSSSLLCRDRAGYNTSQ